MKIYIVRIIGVLAILVWLLIASSPQIVLAKTCTNHGRVVPCPPSGGGKKTNNTAPSQVIPATATDTPSPLPTATVTVLVVIPGTGGNVPEPALPPVLPPTQTPPIPPDPLPNPFLPPAVLVGIIIVLIIIGGLLFGLLVPAVRKWLLGAGPKNGWPLAFGSTTHVMMRDADKPHHFSNRDQNVLDSPDMDDGSVKNYAFEIEDYSFTVDNPTTIGSATGGGSSVDFWLGNDLSAVKEGAPSAEVAVPSGLGAIVQVNINERETGKGGTNTDNGRQPKINEAEEHETGGGGSGSGTNTEGGRDPK